ncbi:MAG: hypothetical protein Q7S27_00580 [Nanoarchaeota archaeon]|nr:hypothetical protein [Nanoarchaeota archaeon]
MRINKKILGMISLYLIHGCRGEPYCERREYKFANIEDAMKVLETNNPKDIFYLPHGYRVLSSELERVKTFIIGRGKNLEDNNMMRKLEEMDRNKDYIITSHEINLIWGRYNYENSP